MTLWVNHLQVSHTPINFGGHRTRCSGDMFLVCHVILQDHITIRNSNLWVRALEGQSLPCQVWGHKHCESGDMILVYHVISKYHMTKGQSNIISISPSRLVTILPSLVAIDTWQWRYDFSLSRDLGRPHDQKVE